MNKFILHILTFILCASIMNSCERRPLVNIDNKVTIRVIVNTDSIQNVTSGIYNSRIAAPKIAPKVMRVIFYDPDTKELRSQGFIYNRGTTPEGHTYLEGEVYVEAGTYDILCYNFDTPTTLIRGEKNWNTITAYTSEISEHLYSRFKSRADNPKSPIYYSPDHLMVGRKSAYTIPEHTEKLTINIETRTIIDTYYIQIKLQNGKYASDALAILTDLSPSNQISANKPKENEYAATFFEMQRSYDTRARSNPNILCAVFNTFGKRPDHIDPTMESRLYITINILTVEGKTLETTIDMDSIFQTEQARNNKWLLIDRTIEVPIPVDTVGGGFKPIVNNWNQYNGIIDITQ